MLELAMVMIGAGLAGWSGAAPTPSPGATLKPGQWRFQDEVLAMSSESMGRSYLERLRSKADGHVSERCIRPGEETSLFVLLDRIGGNAEIEPTTLRDGIIEARVRRVEGQTLEESTLNGTYDAERVEMTAWTKASGSPNPLGNIEFTIRRRGQRIGEC